jgi:hypothetical protein
LLSVIVQKVQEIYLADDRVNLLRAELLRQIEEHREGEPEHLDRLRRRLGEIEADVKQGRENLLRVRDDNVFIELNRALGDLVRERDAVAAEVARMEVTVPDRRAVDQATVEKAIASLRRLGQELASAKPERVREVLLQMLVRVDLHYEELGADWKKRQWKKFLKGVATLRPQVVLSGNEQGFPRL